jgi:hypothetical protein
MSSHADARCLAQRALSRLAAKAPAQVGSAQVLVAACSFLSAHPAPAAAAPPPPAPLPHQPEETAALAALCGVHVE